MSQHDFDIANQTAANLRSDLNSALQALASLSSATTAPSTTYANMLWYETDTNTLWIRNEGDSAWLRLAYVDQSGGVRLFENYVVNTSGGTTGYLGLHAEATWEAGTNAEARLVSPAHVKAAIDAFAPKRFTSSEQTITRGGSLTLAHSLGANPFLVQARYICKTAEQGYSVNDELIANMFDDNGGQMHGTSVVADSTNLNVRFGSGVLVFPHKTTGNRASITEANWRLVVRAMA